MAPAAELRQRKASKGAAKDDHTEDAPEKDKPNDEKKQSRKTKKAHRPHWSCYDALCWLIGNLTVLFFILFVASKFVPSKKATEFVIEKITGQAPPQTPGEKLREEGLRLKHPLVFMPGVVTGGLELWEGRECAEDLFRQRVWGGDFADKVLSKPHCWMDHLILDNETGLDPPNVRVRSVPGLVAADFFMPGYFVWAPIIENAARLGYDHKSMWMADYDWRLSFGKAEKRDRTLTRLKMVVETTKKMNDEKVVLVPHSMGCVFLMFFLKWVEAPPPLGGGGGPNWVNDHIHAIAGIAGPWLGVAKGITGMISAEAKDIAEVRAMAPFIDSGAWGTRAFQHVLRVSRTWESLTSMLPKGGNAVWGDWDWSPEEGYECAPPKKEEEGEYKDKDVGKSGKPVAHYGRFLSFGRELAELEKNKVKERVEQMLKEPLLFVNQTYCPSEVWTEYQQLSTDKMQEIARRGVFNIEQVLDMLREIAPNLMKRADENWGFGVADDPSLPKYADNPKYWSNPLETTLPNAPDMTLYCLQGVGIPTERSYIMKLSDLNESCALPFRIDGTVSGKNEGCLKSGAQFSDGDITINLVSAGYMAAKGWKGRTKYNPGGVKAVMREYKHVAPANFLEGRGTQSANHVDVMGNYAMIEDILRIAAGQTAEQIGGDRYVSKLPEWAERVKIDVGLKQPSTFAQKLGLKS